VEAQQETPTRRSRAQILADVRSAMLELVETKAFRDITVDELSRAAGLSRTAFYFYYRDKNEVLGAAAEDLAAEAYRESERWWSGQGPPEVLVREMLESNSRLYEDHAGIIRAAVEVTSYDAEFAEFYRELVSRFVRATADHLRREEAAGRLRTGLNIDAVAETLCWMSERCHYQLTLIAGRPAHETAETLATVWMSALYPDDMPSG
jgi:AcrR family transcriptional regulator